MPIAKSSGNNARRIEAVKQTISYIKASVGGLCVREMADLLKVSDSTIKGYVYALLGGQIVTREVRKEDAQHPTSYFVCDATDEQIAAFIEQLRYDPSKASQPRPRAPKTQEQRMAQDPRRHFHIADDDEPVKVRISRSRVPEQWPLLAQFFGMAEAAA